MDSSRARELLTRERSQLRRDLGELGTDQSEDHVAERQTGDGADQAQPLQEQGVDDAVAASARQRLAAVDRALQRVDDGTFGRSTRSGAVIPDARLEADPAAELTVQEAAGDEAANR